MRPLTDNTPKPLLRVDGRALIEWHLYALSKSGIVDIVINVAHLGEQIENALGDGSRYGVNISYSREASALETAGGIIQALPLLGRDDFIVVNGDIHTDFDFSGLVARKPPARGAHLVMVDTPDYKDKNDFYLGSEGVLSTESPGQALTYAGIARFTTAFFASLLDGKQALAPLLIDAMQLSRVSGEYYAGRWHDVGTPERLEQLQ